MAKKYIDEHIRLGKIRPSSSPVASSIVLARKPGEGLRFCVDYRALNAIAIKNRYSIPQIQETVLRLSNRSPLDIGFGLLKHHLSRLHLGSGWLSIRCEKFTA